jgi:glycosidase
MRFNTNHDKNAWDRPANLKFGPDGALMTQALVFLLPGVPLVYNGEEVGNTRRLDLFEKVDIDWTSSGSARQVLTTLGALRREHPWLAAGRIVPLQHDGPQAVLAFARQSSDEQRSLVGVYNFSTEAATVRLSPASASEGAFSYRFGGAGAADLNALHVPPRSAVILQRLP